MEADRDCYRAVGDNGEEIDATMDTVRGMHMELTVPDDLLE